MANDSKKIRVTLRRSLASTTPKQRANLHGLGLKKIGNSRELEDTKAIRGMINVVSHMVEVTEA